MANEQQQQRGGNRNPTPEGGEPQRFTDVVLIEVADERNRRFTFNPTGAILRGRWSRANLMANEVVDVTQQMPDIPGQHIEIDGRNRRCRVYDPLNLPENAAVRAEVARLMLLWFNEAQEPEEERVFEKVSDNQLKTWLFWSARLLAGAPVERHPRTQQVLRGGPQAILRAGKMPSIEQITKMPGKIKISHFASTKANQRLSYEDVVADNLAED